MAQRTKPPFRADHVGSLLRRAVATQEDLGLEGVTDGVYRRTGATLANYSRAGVGRICKLRSAAACSPQLYSASNTGRSDSPRSVKV
jgi:hypothetical protein